MVELIRTGARCRAPVLIALGRGDEPGGAVRIAAPSAPADAGVSIMIEPGIQRSCGNCDPVGSR